MGAKKSVFSKQLERELVKHLRMMTDLRKLAINIAVRANIDHPFDLSKGLAGLDWAKGFLNLISPMLLGESIMFPPL